MRRRAIWIVPVVILFGLLGWVLWQSGPDLVAEEQSRQVVKEVWARPLPWYPHMESLTGANIKRSPDGVKMPSGWDGL